MAARVLSSGGVPLAEEHLMPSAEERERLATYAPKRSAIRCSTSPRFILSPGYVRVPAGVHPDHDDAVAFTLGQFVAGLGGSAAGAAAARDRTAARLRSGQAERGG
jgi:hypothetical protein